MLGRLEEAFSQQRACEDRLRTFLADASHELRTPLASIRGYAELFRIGAARDPADTEKAMRRIEAEAARMGVLVEDLLMLARLDEVRDKVREDVDLSGWPMTPPTTRARPRPIARSTGGQRPRRRPGDPDQLRQVFANLLRNALVHTPPGTPIEVDVRDDGAAACSRSATTDRACRATRTTSLRPLLARRGRPQARQGRRGPRPGDRRRHR